MNEDMLNAAEERQIQEAFAARQRRTARAQKANPGAVKKVISQEEYQSRLIKEIEKDHADEEERKQIRLNRNWAEWRKKVGERFRDADTDETSITSRIELLDRGMTHRTSVTLSGDLGVGKAQPLSEPVLTPSGFKPMGDVKENDYVVGISGEPTLVEAVYRQGTRPVYKVTFSDSSYTYCDEEHLWHVGTGTDNNDWMTLTTKEILHQGADSDSTFKIPLVSPVNFAGCSLDNEIDPYLLGVILAGGIFDNDKLSLKTENIDVVQKLEELLPEDVLLIDSPEENNVYVFTALDFSYNDHSLVEKLKRYGLWKSSLEDYRIPELYKTANTLDRFNLMNGLLSTQSNEAAEEVEFASKHLSQDFVDLVNSLGSTCTVYEEFDKLMVSVDSTSERFVERIEYSHYEETQCIQVAAADSLYVTRNYIVTHNTWLAYAYLNKLVKQGIMSPANLVASTETAVLGRIAAGGFKRAEMYEELRNPLKKVYFIDDVGQAYFSSDSMRTEVWYELIDHIYANDLTLIITTNKMLGAHATHESPKGKLLSTWLGEAAYDRLKHIMGPEGLIKPSGRNKRPEVYRERDARHSSKE